MKSIDKKLLNKDIQVIFEILQMDAACNGLMMSDLEKEGSIQGLFKFKESLKRMKNSPFMLQG